MCMDFLLSATDGSFVNGRSMEFGIDLRSKPFIQRRGVEMKSSAPHFKEGLRWTTQYGYVGLNVFGLPILTDGLNERGLSTGCLWLPGSTFQTVTDPARALSVSLFTDWLLGNFADVAAVQAGLSAVEVWADEFMHKELSPVHFPVHDATGRSIVIEFTGGTVQVYDNPLAILTNAPNFPWHLENIRNYVGLTPWDVGSAEIAGESFAQTGHGSGLRGLPGDYTPPSRLIRGLFLKQFANPVKDGPAARNLAFHVLNAHDIPQGTIREKKLLGQQDDYTQWAVVKDLTHLVLQYRYYEHLAPRTIDLKLIDFGKGASGEIAVPAPVDEDITSLIEAR